MSISGWYQVKLLVEHAAGISMDALHILVGFILFTAAAMISRRGFASLIPWTVLLALEVGNEAYDLHVEVWPDLASQLGEGVKDILLTMALPTLVMLLARWQPRLLTSGNSDHPTTT